MARGKRSSNNTYTSKGERPNTNSSALKARRIEYKNSMSRLNNQVKAWRRGKKVMLTIHNPNKKETNKPFIRVNALDVWGQPREMSNMYDRRKKNDRVN
tara:strand:+ start:1766 stop:2062 length:297 start_codon:yes stop_codon:yes gene_type:complete